MGNCYSIDHIDENHIHTDITYNTEEPQQKYRLGTVSNILLGQGAGCLRLGLSWFNWWVSFAPEFLCCYFCESSCLFCLSFNFDFYVSKIMHL